jgi:hypothetical protein
MYLFAYCIFPNRYKLLRVEAFSVSVSVVPLCLGEYLTCRHSIGREMLFLFRRKATTAESHNLEANYFRGSA